MTACGALYVVLKRRAGIQKHIIAMGRRIRRYGQPEAKSSRSIANAPPEVVTVKTLDDYLVLARENHGHLCPGQVLGVRMAILGLKSIGIDDADKFRKRLITFVEIDRCAADAVALVTGCRLGRRTLKFFDYGKVAATFLDLETLRAVRVVARDDAREKARTKFPDLGEAHRQQLEAYKVMDDADLFRVERVAVTIPPEDLPGRPRSRVTCEACGEGINDARERRGQGRILCRSCDGESYFKRVTTEEPASR